MITTDQIDRLIGATVLGGDDDTIGKVGQVYLDDETGQPEWVTVNTGLFGTKESFVPLGNATAEGDTLRVPFAKDVVKAAPRVSTDGHLDEPDEAELHRYYGLEPAEPVGDATLVGGVDEAAGAVGHDTSGAVTDSAMTRSEEELKVGVARREASRARLRKYVVTEQQTLTVPVTREEVRVEREPITDANVGAALDGPAISEEEHEVVLHEEVPVVSTQARPVERIRLGTETVTEQQQVTGDVRKEQVELEGPDGTPPRV